MKSRLASIILNSFIFKNSNPFSPEINDSIMSNTSTSYLALLLSIEGKIEKVPRDIQV